MRVLKTFVVISGSAENRGKVYTLDTIRYEEKLWLVPYWYDLEGTGWSMPVRIIRFDHLQHQKSGGDEADYILNDAIPKDVLDGLSDSESGVHYEVRERPDIRVRNPAELN